ncbi:MAG: insulinase family protein [Massilia sp.]
MFLRSWSNPHSLPSLALCALLCLASQGAGAAPNPADPLPHEAELTLGRLPNGLTYYIQKNARPEKKLELRLVVKAGSLEEDDDQRGVAHMLEHLAFNGSTHFKKHELISYLESTGVKFGPDLNANTSFERTIYILPIQTDQPDNIEKGFTVLADWAGGITLADADIDKERAVVLEEMRLRHSAAERGFLNLLPRQYKGSKFVERYPIGSEQSVTSFTPEAVRRFYRDWYRPDLMALVVVGDIEPAAAEKLIAAHFGGLANQAQPRPLAPITVPRRADNDVIILSDAEASSNRVELMYPLQERRPMATVGDLRATVEEQLVLAMLNERIVAQTEPAHAPYVGGAALLRNLTSGQRFLSTHVVLGRDGPARAIAALVGETERARQLGFGAAELARAKKTLLRAARIARDERERRVSAQLAEQFVGHFLERGSIVGAEQHWRYLEEILAPIGPDEVLLAARQLIAVGAPKLVLYSGVNKDAAMRPSARQLIAAIAEAESKPAAPYQERALAAGLMAAPPAAGTIVGETVDAALGLTRLTLSNGVEVILKPTDFSNAGVTLSARRYGGHSQVEAADLASARYASGIVAGMGLNSEAPGGLRPLDLARVLAGNSARLSANMDLYTEGFAGTCTADDLETLFQLLYLRMSGVRRDEELFRAALERVTEVTRNMLDQPALVLADRTLAALYGDHPWAERVPRADDVARISLDRVIEVYRGHFGSARGYTFILVGAFEVAAVKPLLASYLASLPVGEAASGYRDVGLRPVRGVVREELRIGQADKALMTLSFSGAAPYSRPAELAMQALVEVMELRMTEVLRHRLGLVYTSGISGALRRLPYEHYTLSVYLPSAPASVDRLREAMFAEIARLKEEGPGAAELDKIKLGWQQARAKALRENGFWLAQLQQAALRGTDPAATLGEDERAMAALGAEEVRQAARRSFDMDNYVQMVQLPGRPAGK